MGGIINNPLDAGTTGTVSTTVNVTMLSLDAVTENAATAMAAGWGEDMDGTLEGIKVISRTVHRDFEGIAVGVAAAVTGLHRG